ncbi:hypothetical protein [Roseinatronobacter sp. NSM]|uniref:hypothetical protein n=1 Tax=Roseinatronobacter sp. NSM TaxID=3457785 RepID=UPI0040351F99
MAYLDNELRNARIIWLAVSDRVLVLALIMAGMSVAAMLAGYLGHMPQEITPTR